MKMKKLLLSLLMVFVLMVTAVSAASPVFVGLDTTHTVIEGDILTVTLEANDPDGLGIDYFYLDSGYPGTITDPTANPTTYEYDTSGEAVGIYSIKLSVFDLDGEEETAEITIEIMAASLATYELQFAFYDGLFDISEGSFQGAYATLLDVCLDYENAVLAEDAIAEANAQSYMDSLAITFADPETAYSEFLGMLSTIYDDISVLPYSPEQESLLNRVEGLVGDVNQLIVDINVAQNDAATYCGFVPPSANEAPSITTTSLPAADENVAYSATIVANDPEGDVPLTFDFTGSVLPTGFTTDVNTGIVSGTPSTASEGAYSVVVKATDSLGNEGTTVTLALTVNGPVSQLAQYQTDYLAFDNLFEQYEDDLQDIEDDIEDACDEYDEAVEDDDDNDMDNAEDDLEDIEDDELRPLEDNVDDLERDVENLLDDVENLLSSSAQRNLEDDLQELLDDIEALINQVEDSFDDVDNFCSSDANSQTATPIDTTPYVAPVTVPVTVPTASQPSENVDVVTTSTSVPLGVVPSAPVVTEEAPVGVVVGLSIATLVLLGLLIGLSVVLFRK
jgi:ElaB/YqjD/DUF883 family membrane-anchored ribosome-binding protein